jgi:hypothetical protein
MKKGIILKEEVGYTPAPTKKKNIGGSKINVKNKKKEIKK